tara:strand:- start:15053 stop:17428 length:2376 start_codon:yes stop_codon:yes gene_type:complete
MTKRMLFVCAWLLASFGGNLSMAQPPIPSPPLGRGKAVLNLPASVITLPTVKAATKGFVAEIVFPDTSLPGYIPIEITIRSNTTFTADRLLSLRLSPIAEGHSPAVNIFAADVEIRVDQGSKTTRVTRYIPRWSVGNAYRLQLYEGNTPLKDYETEIGTLNPSGADIPSYELMSESDGKWLHVIDADQEPPADTRDIVSAVSGLPLMAIPDAGGDPWFWNRLENSGVYNQVTSAQLPTDWRGFQAIDAVLLSASSIEQLRQQHVEHFHALRQWLLCGGTVVVTDSSDVDGICRLFDAAASRPGKDVRSLLEDFPKSAEHVLEREQENLNLAIEYVSASRFAQNRVGYTPNDIPGWRNRGTSTATQHLIQALPKPADLVTRMTGDLRRIDYVFGRTLRQWQNECAMAQVSAGQIIGVKAETDQEATRLPKWLFVRNAIGTRRSAMLRRGVDPIIGDARARRWLIPGVAEPPVYTFMGLLGVFVILVGPVAYRQTSKTGRSHLMFAIAPALALCTTLAMFGYGIFADGFGAHARIRQLTWVDGGSGDAGQRVRATYFAGIRPGDGLAFPPDAEVFHYPDPVGLSWEAIARRTVGGSGRVVIKDDEQRFSRSFLPSRQQMQFVYHRPRRDVGTLSIDTSPTRTTLSSEFVFDLRRVIVCDADRRYWFLESLPSMADDMKCDPVRRQDASKMLFDLFLDYRPISQEVDSKRVRPNVYTEETLNLLNAVLRRVNATGNVNVVEGTFEERLQRWLQTESALPPGTFVALTDVTDDAVAIDNVEMIGSVHYVFGTLKP